LSARVVLYGRPSCHLCDVVRAAILQERDRTAFDFTEIDIESDDALLKEYGIRIPVVVIDGEEFAEISLDRTEFAAAVRGRRPSGDQSGS